MLTITQSAIDVVNQVAPGDAGLRIYLPESSVGNVVDRLRLEIVHSPYGDDRVVDVDGARVFLEPAAASALEDMVLDTATEGDKVHFAVTPQSERSAES